MLREEKNIPIQMIELLKNALCMTNADNRTFNPGEGDVLDLPHHMMVMNQATKGKFNKQKPTSP